MPTNMFSIYKQPNKIHVPVSRRVMHAMSDKFKSLSKSTAALEALDKGNLLAGTVGAGGSIACAAGASGAFAAAISGAPATAIMASIGLFLAYKSSRTNVEEAHAILQPYVWSFIDDIRPKPLDKNTRDAVGAAALTLICEGTKPHRLEEKLDAAEKAFNSFWEKYQRSSLALVLLKGKTESQMLTMDTVLVNANVNNTHREKYLETAYKKNGAIFELSRRLIHYGNYLQAAAIVAKIMQDDNAPLRDIPNAGVTHTRKTLIDIETRILSDNKTFDTIARFLNVP